MKASDYIAAFLAEQHVTCVYEIIGGMTAHLVDSLHNGGRVRVVSMHHEQAAAFAADASGRITGIPGVAMATSGPGATNLLTGIGSCFFDSSPALFITGQVNRHEQRGARPIRQLGFQETDIVSMAKPVTKAAWQVQSLEQLPGLLADAFALALNGRPGPVLLDIPMDVQRGELSVPPPCQLAPHIDSAPGDTNALEKLLGALRTAQRPLILVGGGVHSARATYLFRQFVDSARIPVVNSLMAVDVLPYDHPLRVGLIGSYGNRWANLALGRSDVLLVLGSRLDIRQTGAETRAFKEGRAIYHVDCDAGEINNRVTGCHAINSDLRPFLQQVIALTESSSFPLRKEWLDEIRILKSSWPDTMEIRDVPGINPNELMHELSAGANAAAALVVDVGQHQMWAAQSLELGVDQRFLTSGGMGAMGFALPAAIGAAFSQPQRPVVVIAGDGGFQINIQELETISHHRLPVKMVVLNNQCYGMVRQFQQSYFEGRYPATYWGYSAPDFARVASAYHIEAETVAEPSAVAGALSKLWQDPHAPFLLQVVINPLANAYPKIAFGRPITEMEPLAVPLEIEST